MEDESWSQAEKKGVGKGRFRDRGRHVELSQETLGLVTIVLRALFHVFVKCG